jgi:hypothetical protein
MALNDFLNQLSAVHASDCEAWERARAGLRDKTGDRGPVLFWYLSSGLDTQALAYFLPGQAGVRRTPPVDLWFYSDYSPDEYEKIRGYRRQLEEGQVLLFEDSGWPSLHLSGGERTQVHLEQVLPLTYFASTERPLYATTDSRSERSEKRRGETLPTGPEDFDFAYLSVHFWSRECGGHQFPILWAPFDNKLLLQQVLEPLGLEFTYLCGVCDGCRFGHNDPLDCVNEHRSDYSSVAASPSYWITEHGIPLDGKTGYPLDEEVARLGGWGTYNRIPARPKAFMIPFQP